MGFFTEDALDKLAGAGCEKCGSKRLGFRTFVDCRLPAYAGEADGEPVWSYDGEKFVDGVFEVVCASCQDVIFAADLCPRCHAPEGLKRALETTSQLEVLEACPSCEAEELHVLALVPATVVYEGSRVAENVRTRTELFDPGFHGHRLFCGSCGVVGELGDLCPLCGAPGPLRPRPG